MNIKQFIGIDAYGKDKNGNVLSHEEQYATIVNAIGLDRCFACVPATEGEIIQALQVNEHLNTIPLDKWDRQRPYVKRLLSGIGVTYSSLAESNCILKQAARMQVENTLANNEPPVLSVS